MRWAQHIRFESQNPQEFQAKSFTLGEWLCSLPPGRINLKELLCQSFRNRLWDPFKSAAIRTIDSEIKQFPVGSLNWHITVIRTHLLFNTSQTAFHPSIFKMYFYSTYSKWNVHPSKAIPQLAASPCQRSPLSFWKLGNHLNDRLKFHANLNYDYFKEFF